MNNRKNKTQTKSNKTINPAKAIEDKYGNKNIFTVRSNYTQTIRKAKENIIIESVLAFAKHLQELKSEMYIKEFQDDNHPALVKISCPVFKGKNSFFANIYGCPVFDKENTVISGNYEIKDDHVCFKHVNAGTKCKANAAAKDYSDINYNAYPSWFECNLSKDFCVALPPRLRDDRQNRGLVEKWIKSNIKHIIISIIEEFIPRITTLCIKELMNKWFTTFVVNKEGYLKYVRYIIKEAKKDKSEISEEVEDEYKPYIEYLKTLRSIFCDEYLYKNATTDIITDYIHMFLGNLHKDMLQYMAFDSQYTSGNECLFKFSSVPEFTIKCKKSDQIKGIVKGTFTDLDVSKQRKFSFDFVGTLSLGQKFYRVSVRARLGINTDPFLAPFTTMIIDIENLNAKTKEQRIKCIQSAVLNCIRSHWIKYICEERYGESFSSLFSYLIGIDDIPTYISLTTTRNFISFKDFGRDY